MSIYNPFQVIYKITNHINGKVYIGSTNRIYTRHNTHIRLLIKNIHHNKKLQNAWNLYGHKFFSFQIVEFVIDDTDLLLREAFFVNQYNSVKNGYNIRYPESRAVGTQGFIESILRHKTSCRKYVENNRDKCKVSNKTYRDNNKEKCVQYSKEYYVKNKDICKERNNDWVNNNRDKRIAIDRRYKENHKDICKRKKRRI